MMDRLQRMRRMHLSRFEMDHSIAISLQPTDTPNNLNPQQVPANEPLTFRTFFKRADTSRTKQSELYNLRLKKLNAFGLTEVTDRVTMALLGNLGYHTGQNGVSKERRRRILDRVYFNNLPLDMNPALLRQWSMKAPEERLRLLAESLSYVCLSRENQIDPEALVSIRELKEDLDYLKRMYYYPSYDYAWPSIASNADRIIARTIMVKSREEVRVDNLFEAVYTLTRKILSFS